MSLSKAEPVLLEKKHDAKQLQAGYQAQAVEKLAKRKQLQQQKQQQRQQPCSQVVAGQSEDYKEAVKLLATIKLGGDALPHEDALLLGYWSWQVNRQPKRWSELEYEDEDSGEMAQRLEAFVASQSLSNTQLFYVKFTAGGEGGLLWDGIQSMSSETSPVPHGYAQAEAFAVLRVPHAGGNRCGVVLPVVEPLKSLRMSDVMAHVLRLLGLPADGDKAVHHPQLGCVDGAMSFGDFHNEATEIWNQGLSDVEWNAYTSKRVEFIGQRTRQELQQKLGLDPEDEDDAAAEPVLEMPRHPKLEKFHMVHICDVIDRCEEVVWHCKRCAEHGPENCRDPEGLRRRLPAEKFDDSVPHETSTGRRLRLCPYSRSHGARCSGANCHHHHEPGLCPASRDNDYGETLFIFGKCFTEWLKGSLHHYKLEKTKKTRRSQRSSTGELDSEVVSLSSEAASPTSAGSRQDEQEEEEGEVEIKEVEDEEEALSAVEASTIQGGADEEVKSPSRKQCWADMSLDDSGEDDQSRQDMFLDDSEEDDQSRQEQEDQQQLRQRTIRRKGLQRQCQLRIIASSGTPHSRVCQDQNCCETEGKKPRKRRHKKDKGHSSSPDTLPLSKVPQAESPDMLDTETLIWMRAQH
mmetsp:Transcript_43137/g.101334  ORF Transcript_43137/g.101334 Transcript_43137/m.101334 type:complete len:632 (-) Transcript_43137:393-2288(-)